MQSRSITSQGHKPIDRETLAEDLRPALPDGRRHRA
jgi:hypothetical protein